MYTKLLNFVRSGTRFILFITVSLAVCLVFVVDFKYVFVDWLINGQKPLLEVSLYWILPYLII